MQRLELFPELTTAESYIGVEFTDGEDVYVSSLAIEYDEFGCGGTCLGCAFDRESLNDGVNCYESATAMDCAQNPIIWVKKG